MNIEKEIARKKFLSSLFFSVILLISVIAVISIIDDNRNIKLKKKEVILKSKYGSTQVAMIKEILKDEKLTPEEYNKKIDKIANQAIEEVRYKQALEQTAGIVYGNLVSDLYLASSKWGITDKKDLADIQSQLKTIADEEIEVDMERFMGEIGIIEERRESDRFYKERIEVIEDYLPSEKKESYKLMKGALESVFDMKLE